MASSWRGRKSASGSSVRARSRSRAAVVRVSVSTGVTSRYWQLARPILSWTMSGVGERNLGLLAQRSFERRGDYPSLLFEGRWHGSGELWSRSQRLAAGLAELGVAPGERVVVCMANCPEVSIAYQALWLAGAVVTPATFLLPAPDLRHVIANAEACAVITTPEFIDKVAEAVDGLGHVRFVICTEAAGDGVLALAELERADPRPIGARSDD